MVKYFLAFMLLASPSFAEQWIKCIDTTIGTVNFERPHRIQGDCLVLGLCTGSNNTGLAINVFEAYGTEWIDASVSNKKCDRSMPVGFRIVNLTPQEIIDINNALANQQDSALRAGAKMKYDGQTDDGQALRCFAKAVIDESNIHATKINNILNCIDSASNLSDVKSCIFLQQDLNIRTYINAVTAIKGCIDNGDVDE